MISIEEQQSLLLNISKKLKKPVTAYAIGGTAMMFYGYKDSTLDIDLVFNNEEDKKNFKQAAISFGYRELDSRIVYPKKTNRPEMLVLKEHRIDLFIDNVIDFIFSDNMKKRAVNTHQFNNLTLKIADHHDILLMKCATDRIKDIDDARSIIQRANINWDILIEEAKNQINLGKVKSIFELGYFFERLEKLKMKIPKNITDKTWNLLQDQIKKMKRNSK